MVIRRASRLRWCFLVHILRKYYRAVGANRVKDSPSWVDPSRRTLANSAVQAVLRLWLEACSPAPGEVTHLSRSLRGRKVPLISGAVTSAPEAVSPAADRAIKLLQRTQDLMLECRAVAQQSRRSSSQNNRSADLVAALEGGLMVTLHNAVNVLWKPVGTPGEQWLNEQDEKLGPEGSAKPPDGFAKNC